VEALAGKRARRPGSPWPRGEARRPDLRRSAVLVGLLGGAALAILGGLVPHEPTPRGDDLIYERMAAHPFAAHTFPFGYRIGLPLLVHVLPFSAGTGFRLLAWAAAAGAAAAAYLLMCELKTKPGVAAALATLMCVSPPFLVVVIRGGRNTDIATVFLMMTATYFVVRRAHWQLALTLLLGAIVREAVLFVIPLAYALWARRPLDRRAAADALKVGAPAALAYAGLRLGIETVGEAQVPGYAGSLIGERFTVLGDGLRTWFQEGRRMFTVYGPLWLTFPPALREMRFARRGLVLVALCLLAMTFALDWGRMILLGAPVFYPAGGAVLSRHPRWRLPTLLAMLALAVGYAIYMSASGVQNGIIDTGQPPYPVR
jgi:hypothetical protein